VRMIKRLDRLEEAAAAAEVAGAPIGICWSSYEGNRVDAAMLERGELIAADVTIDYVDGFGVPNILVEERVTRDEADVGWVYDRQHEKIGRVVEIEGTLLTWRMAQEKVAGVGSGTYRVVEY
jgi:hypothetical protein